MFPLSENPQREPDRVLPVSDAHFQATLPFLPKTVADLLRVMRLTGARPNEACQLRPADIARDGDVWHGITALADQFKQLANASPSSELVIAARSAELMRFAAKLLLGPCGFATRRDWCRLRQWLKADIT